MEVTAVMATWRVSGQCVTRRGAGRLSDGGEGGG